MGRARTRFRSTNFLLLYHQSMAMDLRHFTHDKTKKQNLVPIKKDRRKRTLHIHRLAVQQNVQSKKIFEADCF